MAIEQVSSGSPLDAYRRASAAMHRSPDVAPEAPEAVRQGSDARRVAESVSGASPAYLTGPDNQPVAGGVGTRTAIVVRPADPAASLEQAGREIERAYATAAPAAVDQIAAGMDGRARTRPETPPWLRDQLLTAEQALRAVTLDAAYAAFEDDRKGSLTPGKLADVVVLSEDILTCPEERIRSAQVVYTIIGGQVRHQRDR